jgi:cell division protein FtsB
MKQHTRRRPRSAGGDATTGMLFWLTMLVLGGVSLGCIALGLARLEDREFAENRLHADQAIPKLISNNIDPLGPVEAPAATEPEPLAPAPRDPSTAEPHFQTELHPEVEKLFMPPAVDAAPVLRREFPATALTKTVTPQPEPTNGENPMMRTWQTLALASLLLASSPTYTPAAGGEPDPKALQKSIDDLRKTVEAMSAKVDKAAAAMSSKDVLAEINRLEKTLSGQIDKVKKDLQTDISGIKEQQLKQQLDLQNLKGLPKKVEALEAEVTAINEELKKLRKQILAGSPVPSGPNVEAALDAFHGRLTKIEKLLESLQTPSIGGERKSFAAPTAPIAGQVRLVNLYVERMMFVVNGNDYFVEPGQMLQLQNFPAGSVTYEVRSPTWGIRAQKTTTLQPTETLSVTAR